MLELESTSRYAYFFPRLAEHLARVSVTLLWYVASLHYVLESLVTHYGTVLPRPRPRLSTCQLRASKAHQYIRILTRRNLYL